MAPDHVSDNERWIKCFFAPSNTCVYLKAAVPVVDRVHQRDPRFLELHLTLQTPLLEPEQWV